MDQDSRQAWKGDADFVFDKNEHYFSITDDSEASFRVVSRAFPEVVPDRPVSGVLFRLDIDVVGGGYPLLRVVNKKTSKVYDAILNRDDGKVTAKRDSKKEDVHLKLLGKKSAKIFMRVPIDEPIEVGAFTVMLYPSASVEFPGYHQEAMGTINVKSITYNWEFIN